jgi:hypothetical protein
MSIPDKDKKETCENCKFFFSRTAEHENFGDCRINPVGYGGWPATHTYDWCGQMVKE